MAKTSRRWLPLLAVGLGLALPASGASRLESDGWVAPPIDPAQLRAEDALQPGGPSRVGLPISTALTPSNSGRWTRLDDGRDRWSLRLQSEGALWIVLGLDRFGLRRGETLEVLDDEGRRRLGPYTSRDVRSHGQLWLPPVDEDSLWVELTRPATLRDVEPLLQIGTVSHGYRPWADAVQPTAAGECNIDVNCPLGDTLDDQRRGVVKLLIGGSTQCSGSLINNTSLSCAPYVLTAEHCGGDPASIEFIFNFERLACEPGAVPTDMVLSGSTLKAFSVSSDYRLLQMDQSPPASWNVYYNGWSRSSTPATEAWTIHHPDGDVKKISYSDDPLTDGIQEGPDHWRVDDWEQGTTEPGSSGGPLFDQDGRIVGQLNVAATSCDNPGQFAEYGKLSASWGLGLAGFLDPAATGATTLDGMDSEFCGALDPRLSYASHVVDDIQDGKADPGEIFALQVTLLNDGPLAASGIVGTLSTAHPLVAILDDQASWPGIPGQQSATSNGPHFIVELDDGFVCGDTVPLDLSVTSNEGSWQTEIRLPTGSVSGTVDPPPFEDDMESGTNGWSVANLVGASPWSQVTTDSNSPTHSWFVPNVSGIRDSVLIMPTLDPMPPGATLRFAHQLNTELGDGGVLEYTTDGSTWNDVEAWITEGPYNSVIPVDFASPIGGRNAWSGDLGGWRTVRVDLSELEGQVVTLRWRFASDTFSGGAGWYVDDVVLEAPTYLCCPDFDGDGSCPAPDGNDCNDGNLDVYPGAPQICDGLNNDCDSPIWPALPENETDGDGDGVTPCAGDCNGSDPGTRPGAVEACDGFDNDCNGLVDDDLACEGSCAPPEVAGGVTPLAVEPFDSEDPALAWGGGEHGVVWSDSRDGNFEIYFSRVGALGQPVGDELRVTTAALDSTHPTLVWSGSRFGVAWCDDRNGSPEAFFTLLDATGARLGADELLGDCLSSGLIAATWSGTEYGVAWEDPTGEIRFTRVESGGTEIADDIRISDTSGTARTPSVIWNGSEYALAWNANDGSANQVYFARLDATGGPLGQAAVTANGVNSRRPALIWDGSGYGVGWNEGNGQFRTIHFARLDAAGGVLGTIQVTAGASGSGRPGMAWTGEEYAMAWRDLRDGNGEIYLARIDASGAKIGGDLRVTDGPADSRVPSLAWSGVDYALAWEEAPEVRFTRVGCNCTDGDGDGRSSCEDNCVAVYNPSQADVDVDSEGDACDLNDGVIYVSLPEDDKLTWQAELGFDSWNAYRGDLDVLRSSGLYTQMPGSNPLAERQCGLVVPEWDDTDQPASGKTAFYLVAGESGGLEGDLGEDSSGTPRPNDHPCP